MKQRWALVNEKGEIIEKFISKQTAYSFKPTLEKCHGKLKIVNIEYD